MKKVLGKHIVLAVFLVALYILGLILSGFTISAYPLSRQKSFHIKEAQEIAQKYLESNEETFTVWLDGALGGKTQLLIYDLSGNCLLNQASEPGLQIQHQKNLSAVLNGNVTYKLQFTKEPSPTIHNLMGITGVPLTDQSTIIGAVFMIKKTIAVTESLIGYASYFTLLYWLTTFFIVSNIRKKARLEQLQQNYIANVTHALKTPVASIKALSETLCDGVEPDPDRQRVYYGMILQEANRQDHMIRDILELSKLQSHGADFSKTRLSSSVVFDPVLDKYAALCDCMDITLQVSESIHSLPMLYTNEACVKQILEILLDNAIKFVPDGGLIRVDATVSGKIATICVRDNGTGISKDALPHVFERFFKGSHDFNSSGSGLGLAIAQELTAGLKEKIWVESELGKGSAFFFTIHLK